MIRTLCTEKEIETNPSEEGFKLSTNPGRPLMKMSDLPAVLGLPLVKFCYNGIQTVPKGPVK